MQKLCIFIPDFHILYSNIIIYIFLYCVSTNKVL